MSDVVRDATLSRSDLTWLEQLKGKTYLSISGKNLPDYLLSSERDIKTDGLCLRIAADTRELEFDDEWDFYAFISVAEGKQSQVETAKRRGTACFQRANQQIREVSVIRARVTQMEKRRVRLTYECDVAVVVEFEQGALLIELSTIHSEPLNARFLDAFRLDNFQLPVLHYEDEGDFAVLSDIRQLTLAQCLESLA